MESQKVHSDQQYVAALVANDSIIINEIYTKFAPKVIGYVCKNKADKMALPTKDPHRAGLGVKIRIVNPMKRMKVLRGLIVRGVSRVAVSSDFIYFDTDDLKPMALYLR